MVVAPESLGFFVIEGWVGGGGVMGGQRTIRDAGCPAATRCDGHTQHASLHQFRFHIGDPLHAMSTGTKRQDRG